MDYLISEVQMTSRELAELTGKQHSHVMRDIRNEIDSLGNEGQSIFGESSYVNSQNKQQPCYTFGKKGAMQLALKYDAVTRFKVINKLEELEKRNKMPTHIEALRLYADQLEENQKLLEQNKLMLPKAELHDTFLSADGTMTMNECAKAIGYGRNKLFSYLRENAILMKNNLPYQSYIDRDYFTVREVIISHSDYQDIKSQTLVTTKGCSWIAEKLKKDGLIM